MEMDNTIKGHEVNEIVEELSRDTRSKYEDYDIATGKFDFHFTILTFNML
jgi:hypothetical protein